MPQAFARVPMNYDKWLGETVGTGTLRMIGAILLFVFIGGTLFHILFG